MKKKTGNDLDFYYLSKDNNRVQKKKKHPKKKTKKKNPEPINDDMFNIDNEIVIGVTVLPSKDEKNKNKKNHPMSALSAIPQSGTPDADRPSRNLSM